MRKEERVDELAQARHVMTAAQAGDPDGYERVLRNLMPELANFLRARLRHHPAADDVVQKVLLAIHHSRQPHIRPERRLSPLLRAVLNGGRSSD